ncbi:MAG: phospholipid carrier-dependent glycosyltransferase [Gammaproteobacteria bacterium]
MQTLRKYRWLLISLLAAVYGVLLAVRPLAENDEFRYAEIAREILASGNWVSPTLAGVRYFEKPIFGHWVNAVSLAAFGETAFAARLPSALFTIFTGLFLYQFARRVTPRPFVPAFALFAYLSCMFVWFIGSIAILDPLLNLPVTAAIGLYYLAWKTTDERARRVLLALVGLAAGVAFLTKGFLALALPVIVVGPFLLWRREWSRFVSDLWLPVIVAFVVVLPWALLINAEQPDFWRYFFWEEHIRRFFGEDEAQHAQPVWFFLAALPLLGLPWTMAAPTALAGLRRGVGDPPLVVFLALWFAMPFLFFSFSSGKLLTYVAPCFPPAALLLALGIDQSLEDPARRGVRRGALLLGGLFSLGLVYLLANRFGLAGRLVFAPAETSHWLLGLLGLGSSAAIAFVAGRASTAASSRPWILGLSVLGLFLTLPLALPERTRESKMPGELMARLHAAHPDAVIISHGSLVRSVSWVFKTIDNYVLDPGELRYGLAYPDTAHRLLEPEGVGRLIAANAGKRDILIIVPDAQARALAPYLQGLAPIDHNGDNQAWLVPANPP